METSTPLRADRRRLSLLNSTNLAGSPLRRRGSNLPTARALALVDDDEERNTRRSLVATKKQALNGTGNSSPLSESAQLIDESQIRDHLRICTKLYTENRISAKNAWHLHVIDVMRKIAMTNSNNANLLQVAGSSLDIGSKVYGLRVDDVHTKGLQLASSMTKINEEKRNSGNDGDEEALEPLDQTHKRTRRKKIKKLSADKKNIIDKEGNSLFASVSRAEIVAFSTKESIDVSAADNLFTHKLPTNPATHLFMQMSKEKYWDRVPDNIFKDDGIVEESLVLPQIKHINMCLAFKQFEIGVWDPEQEEMQLAEAPSLPEAMVDEEGTPIYELDGSLQTTFVNNDIAEDPASDPDEQMQNVVRIEDAIPEEHRIETDYGYNVLVRTTSGKYIDKIWAGPSHWKVKFNKRSSARFSGYTVLPVVRHAKKLKVAQKIVFAPTEDVCTTMQSYVPKRTPAIATSNKSTLPAPECFENFDKVMDELIVKPILKRPIFDNKITNQNLQQCDEMRDCNCNNPDGSFYSSHDNMCDDNNEEPMQTFEENVAIEQGFLGDNLVNAPKLVSASHVPYAMQAKKMDMKKLKTALWKQLTDEQGVVKPVDFSALYSEVPQLLNSDMKKELSSPLAFVALLHLCNDNNLILHKKPNCNDFTVSKAVE